ncbi:Uncharacterised protein [Vibrio cholerae]|nr:Uncharacterised protein [Vibrio cholerae]
MQRWHIHRALFTEAQGNFLAINGVNPVKMLCH